MFRKHIIFLRLHNGAALLLCLGLKLSILAPVSLRIPSYKAQFALTGQLTQPNKSTLI